MILMPPADICVARVRGRRDQGFADESVTRHMYRDFADAEIDTRHVIDNGTASPDETADLLLSARRSGALTYESH